MATATTTYEGVVLRIKLERRFGFIGVAGQPDVYFHSSDCYDLDWDEQLVGRRVRFRIITNGKGQRAVSVEPAYK